ncbi:MAG: hypothetical protein HOV66_09845 [Streptomycetaceae bacterium]|jgi:hypothetical protein|nr:hypothetical protein [Streptomycetaceae bacterium]
MSESLISTQTARLVELAGIDERSARAFVAQLCEAAVAEAETHCAEELEQCRHERAHLMRALAEARATT